jgi:hypothetical protein
MRARRGNALSRKQLLISIGIAMVLFDIALVFLDQKMKDAGGSSILGFEFAGSDQHAGQITAEWGDGGRDYARWSLWIDFGFMVSYGAFFTIAAIATRDFAEENGLRRLATVGIIAPLCAGSAPVFDALENLFLLLTLGGHGGSFGPPVATACASLKFLLITVAIVYVLWGLASRFLRHRRARWEVQAIDGGTGMNSARFDGDDA